MTKPLVLCILDGCGMRENTNGNAFANAQKPNFDRLWNEYPHCLLKASGEDVGLPFGQMGTSEVGHMTIGSGRVVYQPLEKINKAIEDGSFFEKEELLKVVDHLRKHNSTLHIMGLLSDGGVHSHIDHLLALIDYLSSIKVEKVCYHIFTDGRDTEPKSALEYIEKLEKKIENRSVGRIATVSGRYYAMDRDDNYDRVTLAYDAIVKGIGPKYDTAERAILSSYEKGITDEFVLPCIINSRPIEDGDAILTFNFRKDRLRELFTAFTNRIESPLKTVDIENVHILTMFPVTDSVKCPHVFEDAELSNGLGEYLHKNGLHQLRIAETEKYAHVTFFFDGGEEREYVDMKKILIPSPKVATYDLTPKMSAYEITNALLSELDENAHDCVILNFANGDMVGHTGNYSAAVEAVSTMDECLGKIYDKIREKDGILIVTADHGNCDTMWDENHEPVTSHTLEKVPFILTKKGLTLKEGNLSNIAPTILDLLGLVKPIEMTSTSLIEKK